MITWTQTQGHNIWTAKRNDGSLAGEVMQADGAGIAVFDAFFAPRGMHQGKGHGMGEFGRFPSLDEAKSSVENKDEGILR